MGLWARINGEDLYDKYAKSAHETLGQVRKDVRRKYGNNLDTVRPKEAEELKLNIRRVNEQGGIEIHKHALARWQVFKALYPEWITDADRPELIPKSWENSPHL